MNCIFLGKRVRVKQLEDGTFSESTVMEIALGNGIKEPMWEVVTDLGDIYQLVVWENGVVFDRRDVFDVKEERLSLDYAGLDNHIADFENGNEMSPFIKFLVKKWVSPIEGKKIDVHRYWVFGEKMRKAFGSSEDMCLEKARELKEVREREMIDRVFVKENLEEEMEQGIRSGLGYE